MGPADARVWAQPGFLCPLAGQHPIQLFDPSAWPPAQHQVPDYPSQPEPKASLTCIRSAVWLCPARGWPGVGGPRAPCGSLPGARITGQHESAGRQVVAAGGRAPLSATKNLQLDPQAPPTLQEIRRPPTPFMPRPGSTNPQPRPGFATPHGPSSCLSTQTLPHPHSHIGPHLTLEKLSGLNLCDLAVQAPPPPGSLPGPPPAHSPDRSCSS